MKFSVAALLLAPALALATAVPKLERKINYDGFRAFRISTHGAAPEAIKARIAMFAALPFSAEHADHVDVVIPPEEISAFEALGLDTEVLHEDLGADIATEGAPGVYETTTIGTQAVPSLTWFDNYHAYADHRTFFNDLQASFPTTSEIFTIGNSVQGRPIFGIHLWGSAGKGARPAVYFHGTVHAREWISAKVVEYITYQLMTQYSTNATVAAIRNAYDFYIIPFVNPDGFVYSQTNDRLWRKNRQTRTISSCVGTDMNRNWNYQWSLTGGASTNPCAETYKGQAAADTPEIRALQTFTSTLSTRGIKLYIDWHSFGQYILLPYGYNCNARAANHQRQMTLAGGLSTRIAQSYGTRFTYGPSCSTLYATTGSAPDYMTDVARAELAWTIELRPTGSSSSGFILAASQILPSGIEQWNGMLYLLTTM